MNISTKLFVLIVVVIVVVSTAIGMYVGYRYTGVQMHKDGYVKLEVTRTGTFFIDDGKIFSVSELETEKQFSASMSSRKD